MVRLRLPRTPEDMGVFVLEDPGQAGTRDLPPVLEDADEKKILFWLRAFRPVGPAPDERAGFGKVVHHILDRHRPAHTICDLCTVDSGMRVGMGLYVDLSTIVGQSGRFDTLQLGRSLLGRRDIVGRPRAGVDVGNSALGYDSRSG